MSGGDVSTAVGIGGSILSAAATAKSMFSSAPKTPSFKAPTNTPAVTMPTMDDDAVQKARLRAVQQRMAASGRQSTILSSNNGDDLGG